MARAAAVVAAFVLVALGLGGCAEGTATGPGPDPSTSVSASPTAPLPEVGAGCPEEAAAGLRMRLTNGAGDSIAAVELGEGPLAVLLAHQSDGSLCEWLPYGRRLVELGYRVLAFDFAGSGSSTVPEQLTYVEDIRTGVDYLRSHGAEKVVLMGASMGATMSVVAAAVIEPPVDGVIAVSPPETFDGVNAQKAAPSVRSPALCIAGDLDGDYAIYARGICEEIPSDLGDVVVVNASDHGVRLVGDTDSRAGRLAREAIEEFLAAHLVLTEASPTPSAS